MTKCNREDGKCGYPPGEACWVCPIRDPSQEEAIGLADHIKGIQEKSIEGLKNILEEAAPPPKPRYIAPMYAEGAGYADLTSTFEKVPHQPEWHRRNTLISEGANPLDPHLDNPNYPYCIKGSCEIQGDCGDKGSCIWATVAANRGTQEELDLVLSSQTAAISWRDDIDKEKVWPTKVEGEWDLSASASSAERKDMRACTGVLDYFPDAILEVGRCSKVAGDKHHPGAPMWWDRPKSSDHPDALVRHLLERGKIDTDGVRHSAKVAWRALAILQLEIEEARK